MVVCPGCGETVSEWAARCAGCGHDLALAEPTPDPPTRVVHQGHDRPRGSDAPARTRKRRLQLTLAAIVVLAIAAAVVALLRPLSSEPRRKAGQSTAVDALPGGTPTKSPTGPPVTTGPSALSTIASSQVRVSVIALGAATDVAVGAGGVWVPGFGVLHRLDPQSGRIVATIPVAGSSDNRSVAIGDGAVWVTDSSTATLTRVDPGTNRVVASIRIGGAPAAIAEGFHTVWVLNQQSLSGGTAIQPIDPTTNRVGAPVPIFHAGHITIGATAVWVDGGPCCLYRLDPLTHVVSKVIIPDHLDPSTGLAVPIGLAGAGADLWLVWVGGMQRADPVTANPVGPILHIATGPLGVTPWALWIVQQPDSTKPSVIQDVDPTLLKPVGPPITVGVTAVAVAAAGQSVWVANFNAGTVSKIDLVY